MYYDYNLPFSNSIHTNSFSNVKVEKALQKTIHFHHPIISGFQRKSSGDDVGAGEF